MTNQPFKVSAWLTVPVVICPVAALNTSFTSTAPSGKISVVSLAGCTFQRQGGQSGADRGGGASPPLCGGPSRSADAGTWDPHGRGGLSSQAVHGEDSKRAAGLVGLQSPRAAEIGCDQVEGRAVRAD